MLPQEAADKAESFFKKGYTCSQAVFCTFLDEFGLDEKTALKVSLCFGGGIGRMREVCGCVSGMAMCCGMMYGSGISGDKESKDKCYKITQELANKFKNLNGSIICKELLGLESTKNKSPISEERTSEYYAKRPCAKLAALAASLFCEYINSNQE